MSANVEDGTLWLRGRIDAAAAADIYRQWRGRAGTLRVVDLSAVTRIDSAGVALVQALLERAREAGPGARLQAIPDRYRQVCEAHRIGTGADPE